MALEDKIRKEREKHMLRQQIRDFLQTYCSRNINRTFRCTLISKHLAQLFNASRNRIRGIMVGELEKLEQIGVITCVGRSSPAKLYTINHIPPSPPEHLAGEFDWFEWALIQRVLQGDMTC